MPLYKDLTSGKIAPQLVKLAFPIIFTLFFQLAYGLNNIFWIGKLGSDAVAAVTTATRYIYLGVNLILTINIGVEVLIAQSLGSGNIPAAEKYAVSGLHAAAFFALLYGFFCFIFAEPLIALFKLGNEGIDPTRSGIVFLRILISGSLFFICNPVMTSIFNGYGNTRTPFLVMVSGLLLNIPLTPAFIYGYLFLPPMNYAGAAVATVVSQTISFVIFIFLFNSRHSPLHRRNLLPFGRFNLGLLAQLARIGAPQAAQNTMFNIIDMQVSITLAKWGTVSIAVKRLGGQLEGISFMTARGFSTALSVFTGQNLGKGNYRRLKDGYRIAQSIMVFVGVISGLFLWFFSRELVAVFFIEQESINAGSVYLRFQAFIQLFMCIEIASTGAFTGLGITLPPAVVSVFFNLIRIPGAIILPNLFNLGVNGVWLTIIISCMGKGIGVTAWYLFSREKIIKKRKAVINKL